MTTGERFMGENLIAQVAEQKKINEVFSQMYKDCADFLEMNGLRIKHRSLAIGFYVFSPILARMAKRDDKDFNPKDLADELSYRDQLRVDNETVNVILTSDTARPTKISSLIHLQIQELGFSLKLQRGGAVIQEGETSTSQATAKDANNWKEIVDLVTGKTPQTSSSN